MLAGLSASKANYRITIDSVQNPGWFLWYAKLSHQVNMFLEVVGVSGFGALTLLTTVLTRSDQEAGPQQ